MIAVIPLWVGAISAIASVVGAASQFAQDEPEVPTPGEGFTREQSEFREELRDLIRDRLEEEVDLPTAREELPEQIRQERQQIRQQLQEDVDFPTVREELPEDIQEERETLRDILAQQFDPEQTDELVESLRRTARREAEAQRQRGETQLESALAQRGLQDSGIALEAINELNRDVGQRRAEAERRLQQLQSQRQQQSLQQALSQIGRDINLARQSAGVPIAEEQAQQNRLSQALSQIGRDINLAQQASQVPLQEQQRRANTLQQALSLGGQDISLATGAAETGATQAQIGSQIEARNLANLQRGIAGVAAASDAGQFSDLGSSIQNLFSNQNQSTSTQFQGNDPRNPRF